MAALFFAAVLDEAKAQDVLSDEHFTVDGTLLEAWAGLKSFKRGSAPTISRRRTIPAIRP